MGHSFSLKELDAVTNQIHSGKTDGEIVAHLIDEGFAPLEATELLDRAKKRIGINIEETLSVREQELKNVIQEKPSMPRRLERDISGLEEPCFQASVSSRDPNWNGTRCKGVSVKMILFGLGALIWGGILLFAPEKHYKPNATYEWRFRGTRTKISGADLQALEPERLFRNKVYGGILLVLGTGALLSNIANGLVEKLSYFLMISAGLFFLIYVFSKLFILIFEGL